MYTHARTHALTVMDMLGDKTIGLVGYGSIGQATGRLAKSFGCKVLALRRNPGAVDESGVADEVYGFDDRETFFGRSDYIVCSLPNTPETLGFISSETIEMMKPSAVFVSIGRGAVVDEAALAEALATRRIHGAALDGDHGVIVSFSFSFSFSFFLTPTPTLTCTRAVFVKEPLPSESPLWGLDNVIITAHNADYTAGMAAV